MKLILDEKKLWKVTNDNHKTTLVERTTIAKITIDAIELSKKRKKAVALITSAFSSGVLLYLKGEKDPLVIWIILKNRYVLRTQTTYYQILHCFI
jgi:hypothetical protein